jgi:hypothetical protein
VRCSYVCVQYKQPSGKLRGKMKHELPHILHQVSIWQPTGVFRVVYILLYSLRASAMSNHQNAVAFYPTPIRFYSLFSTTPASVSGIFFSPTGNYLLYM